MGMTIEQAEKLLDDLATREEFFCKRADDASGYTRSGNESIRTSNAKTYEQHAKEYRQILRYLAEYRLMKADYENRLKADMVAMLEKLKLEIKELWDSRYDVWLDNQFYIGKSDTLEEVDEVIQQKINELKENTDAKA